MTQPAELAGLDLARLADPATYLPEPLQVVDESAAYRALVMVPRDTDATLAWLAAEHEHPSQDWTGWCLKATRSARNVPARYASAADAWRYATERHPGDWTPPRGAPVFTTGGSQGYGHAMTSIGGGFAWTTDAVRRGQIDVISIKALLIAWPNHTYAGWTQDINGVHVLDIDDPEEPLGGGDPLPPPHQEDDMQYRIIADAGRGGPAYAWRPDMLRPLTREYFDTLVTTGAADNKIEFLPSREFDILKDMVGGAQRQAAAAVVAALPSGDAAARDTDAAETYPPAGELAATSTREG